MASHHQHGLICISTPSLFYLTLFPHPSPFYTFPFPPPFPIPVSTITTTTGREIWRTNTPIHSSLSPICPYPEAGGREVDGGGGESHPTNEFSLTEDTIPSGSQTRRISKAAKSIKSPINSLHRADKCRSIPRLTRTDVPPQPHRTDASLSSNPSLPTFPCHPMFPCHSMPPCHSRLLCHPMSLRHILSPGMND